MARVKPYSGNSAERLTGLIKASNPKANKPNITFEFGVPVHVDNAYLNTTIFTRPVVAPSAGLEPPAPTSFEEIQYRRLGLEVLNYLPACEVFPVIGLALPFTIHDELDKINEALGLNLTPAEVVNHRYTNAAPTYKLEIANGTNLAWTKSHFMFEADVGVEHNTRTLENGSTRIQESDTARIMEHPVVV